MGSAAFVTALAAILLSHRRANNSRDVDAYTTFPGEGRRAVLGTYRGMVALLVKRGLPPRGPIQTPRDYVAQVAPFLAVGRETVVWLSDTASVAAYDPSPVEPSIARQAAEILAGLHRPLRVRPT